MATGVGYSPTNNASYQNLDVIGPAALNADTNASAALDSYPQTLGRTVGSLADYLANNATIDPLDFGAVGDGVANDSAALQTCLATGLAVDLKGRTYACNNLTQNTNNQGIISTRGVARLVKNANGALFTSSGLNVNVQNVEFRGDASTPTFTGHNVVSSGDNFTMVNCGSRWAYGRAVKATGQSLRIMGTCDIYQGLGLDGTDFDIDVGVSGTATLYHQLFGIVSTQSTGGIRLTDCGSQAIVGGQFGALSILSGTSPAGVNSGMVIGARILGPVIANLSNGQFVGCELGASATLTFGAGTTGLSFDASNLWGGAAVTNNGNANNVIVRQTSAGGTIKLAYGDDASAAYLEFDGTGNGRVTGPRFLVPNNTGSYAVRNAADDADAGTLSASGANNVVLIAALASLILEGETTLLLRCNGVTGASMANDGVLSLAKKLYLAQDTGAVQTACAVFAGTGVPNNANGANGDFYFRGDGTAAGNTVIYHKEGGSWVALTTT